MKRLVLLIATLALALAGPATAKGPDQATITGPGLDGGKIVFRSGGGDPHVGSKFMAFVESVGFFPAMFETVPNPMLGKRPNGSLGPRYKIVYRVPGPNGDDATIRQDLYPYAVAGVVSYMKPGQPFFGGSERTRGGWFLAGHPTKTMLVAAGFPSSAPTGGGSWFDPGMESWLVPVVLVLLLGIGAAVAITRRLASGRRPSGTSGVASRLPFGAMATPVPIDVRHLGTERVVGSYLLETEDGPALFDCGPASTLETLKVGLRDRGVELAEVRHLLLSHIHLDHAGAAGVIVREHPHVQVHVSAIGAPHLVDPSRLETSARRLYGDAFDELWGELAPVPEANVNVVGERVLGLDCFPSPGHAPHHVCYVDTDGTLYAGDAAGVRIAPERLVFPPTPPPGVDVDAWDATIDEIGRRAPERLALVHFGVVDDVERHLESLRRRLHEWAELVAGGATQDEFVAAVSDGTLNPSYAQAMPLWQSYAGLKRWAETVRPSRSQASAAG